MSDPYHEMQRDRQLQYTLGYEAVPRREYGRPETQAGDAGSKKHAGVALALGLALIIVIALAIII